MCGHPVAEVPVPQAMAPMGHERMSTGRELANTSLCLGGQGLAFAVGASFVALGPLCCCKANAAGLRRLPQCQSLQALWWLHLTLGMVVHRNYPEVKRCSFL